MPENKIFIVGSEGFIGSHLVEFYLNLGWNVVGMDLSKRSVHQIEYYQFNGTDCTYDNILDKAAVDRCVNAAGNGDVNFSVTNPYDDFKSNTLMTIKLLESLKKNSPSCKYVHISSAAVYGNPIKLPTAEEDEINPISPYGWHKFLAEQACKEFYEKHGVRSAIIRPFSVYGPGLRKQLLWDVFQKLKNGNGELELWGTGDETRDYVYIDDLILSIDALFKHSDMKASIYNVASGESTTIAEMVNLLLSSLKSSNTVAFNGITRKGNPLHWKADIGKIRELGFMPSIKLNDGISKLTDWMNNLK